jgi:peptide/nickel transport system permease protein
MTAAHPSLPAMPRPPGTPRTPRSPGRPVLRASAILPFLRGRERVSMLVGAAILGLVVIAAVFAPLICTYSPTALNPIAALQAPSTAHYFGTDQFGRDIFARTVYAARIDLIIAFSLVSTAFLIGTALGVVAGWAGGVLDNVLMRIVDVALAFPFLVLVISIVGLRGPGLFSLYIAVSIVSWVFYARLVRSEVRQLRHAEYMLAAKASDYSTLRVLGRHLLPNVIIQPLVYASSDLVYALLLGASVSYLGLGVQPPTPEWGQMVQDGSTFIGAQWWLSFFPGAAIVVTAVAFSLIGDGLAALAREGSAQ